MSAFHDVRFPLALGLTARGGPERRTDIVERVSGFEERNTPWAHSRRRWDAAPGLRSLDDVAELVAFFEARKGRLYGFRFSDPMDHKSCNPSQEPGLDDQQIAIGDGRQIQFSLTKTYGDEAENWVRPIQKPVAGSVLIAVGGQASVFELKQEGQIVFETPPAEGERITAGFRFDVPVRFDTDRLDIMTEGFDAADIGSIPLVEIRL